MQISIAKTENQIIECFPVVKQLRPHLTKEAFLNAVKLQQKKGYKLVFLKNDNKIVSVAGFRIIENLSSGRFLFIDDLVTDEDKRSQGFGDALFNWLLDFAKKEKCSWLQLDSGVQKKDAHRFYFRNRMGIYSYRFGLPLK